MSRNKKEGERSMDIIHGPALLKEKTAAALGSFDGLHQGHMALVRAAVEKKKLGCASVVYTFDRHPSSFFQKKQVPLLTTNEIREEILQKEKVDYFYIETTGMEYWSMEPEAFVKNVLKERLNAGWVIAGENYRFGAAAKGDCQLLKQLCSEWGIQCQIVKEVCLDGHVVSASALRAMVQEGEMERLSQGLGRYFRVQGTVGHGRQVGRTLGFPTANLAPSDMQITPRRGVYAAFVWVEDEWYPAVTNVGIAPTFGVDQVLIESNLLGFHDEIYGKEIKVDFVKYIRTEKKFGSLSELVSQIARDSASALEILKGGRQYE